MIQDSHVEVWEPFGLASAGISLAGPLARYPLHPNS